MIEIIKHGSTYKKIKCEKCGCEFTFTESDTYLCQCYGEREYDVRCPECGYPNDIKQAKKAGAE